MEEIVTMAETRDRADTYEQKGTYEQKVPMTTLFNSYLIPL